MAGLYPLDPPAIAQFFGPGNWLMDYFRADGGSLRNW